MMYKFITASGKMFGPEMDETEANLRLDEAKLCWHNLSIAPVEVEAELVVLEGGRA